MMKMKSFMNRPGSSGFKFEEDHLGPRCIRFKRFLIKSIHSKKFHFSRAPLWPKPVGTLGPLFHRRKEVVNTVFQVNFQFIYQKKDYLYV